MEEIVSRKHISPLKNTLPSTSTRGIKQPFPPQKSQNNNYFPHQARKLATKLAKNYHETELLLSTVASKTPENNALPNPLPPLVSTGIKQSPITRARSLRQSRVKKKKKKRKKKKNFYSTRRVFHLRSGPPPSLRPPIKRNSNATTPPPLSQSRRYLKHLNSLAALFFFFFFFLTPNPYPNITQRE